VKNGNGKRVYIYNKSRETFVATEAGVADTYLQRLIGLIGQRRRWARPGNGLLIKPSRGVHTFGMLFPLDLVFLDNDNQVVRVEEHLNPFSISSVCLKASSVLELPPYTIFRTGTRVGDRFDITQTA